MKNKITKLTCIACVLMSLNGCLMTKIVTVPMRVGGAIISVIPVVGNSVDAVIDTAADVVDAIPL